VPREISFEVPVDTSLFSAVQLQPKAVLSMAFSGLTRWLRAHLVSYPRLLGEFHFGVVFLGFRVTYRSPLGFFDADALEVTTRMKVMREGTRLGLDTHIAAPTGPAASVSMLLCPVAVREKTSLAAEPAPLPDSLLRKFADDEIDPTPPRRTMPPLLEDISQTGEEVGPRGEHAFTVTRPLCEVADQWYFAEIPRLVEPAREGIAIGHQGTVPALNALVGKPMTSMEVELTRPYFWLQQGRVDSTAYRVDGGIAVVHRLSTTSPVREDNGVVIERFAL
jgi:hypothetical protein